MAGKAERPVSLREVRKGNGEISKTGQAPQAGESGTPGGAVGSRAAQPDQPVSSPSVGGIPDEAARRTPDAAQVSTPDGSGSNQPEPTVASAPTSPSPDSPQPPSRQPQHHASGENAPYVYVIGNQTASVMDQARTIASETIRSWYKPGDEETADAQRTRRGKRDKKPGSIRRFFEKAKLHLTEERHRQRLIGEAAAAVRQNNNLQTLCSAPVIRGALTEINGDHKRDEHQANQIAKARQVRIQHEHGIDFGAQRIGQDKEVFPLPKDGQVFRELVNIIDPLVTKGESMTPEMVEHAVLDVVRRHEQATEVRAIFGKDGRGRDYRMVATDLLQQAQQQREAHGDAYSSGDRELQKDIDIVFANLRDGARSRIEKNWIDKVVDFSQNQLRGVVNPMTVATAAATVGLLLERAPSAILQATEKSKHVLPNILGPAVPLYLAVASGAAGLVAGFRHRKELNDDVELHRRQDANGEAFTTEAKRREQMQKYTHHDGVTAQDLIQGGGVDTRGEQRVSLETLRERIKLDTSDTTAQHELINSIGEIQARRVVSDFKNVDTVTSRGLDTTLDQGDLRLTQEIAESMVTLKNAVGDREAVQRQIAESRARWQDELEEKVKKTEKDFKKYALGQSAKVGAIAAGSALAFGEIIRYGLMYGYAGIQELVSRFRPTATVPGEPIIERRAGSPKDIDPAVWRANHTAQVEDAWYGNNTRTSDLNELELHNQRVGDATVTWNISDMTNTGSHSWNNQPEVAHVQNLIQQGEIYYSLWNPDVAPEAPGGLNNPIIAQANAAEGGLLLNQQAGQNATVNIWKNGQMETVSEAELSQYVFNRDLGGYQANSDYSNFENKFNVNVSAGTVRLVDGQWTFQAFATSQGEGVGGPIQVPTEETVVKEGPPVPAPESPKTWIDIAVPVPISPRQALEKTQETPLRTDGIPLYVAPVGDGRRVRADSPQSDTPPIIPGPGTPPPPRPADELIPPYGVVPAPRWDRLNSEAGRLPATEAESVDEVLKGLLLKESHYTDAVDNNGKKFKVRNDVRSQIAQYLQDAEARGIDPEDAKTRFKSFYNFVRLRKDIQEDADFPPAHEKTRANRVRQRVADILQGHPEEIIRDAQNYVSVYEREALTKTFKEGEYLDWDNKIRDLAYAYLTIHTINQLGENGNREAKAAPKASNNFESEQSSTTGNVDNVLKGLMLKESFYKEEVDSKGNKFKVKDEVRSLIAQYLQDAQERGIDPEEAEKRFSTFFNFIRLRDAKKVKTLDALPFKDYERITESDRQEIREDADELNIKDYEALFESFAYANTASDEKIAEVKEKYPTEEQSDQLIRNLATAYTTIQAINQLEESKSEAGHTAFESSVELDNEASKSFESAGSSSRGGRPNRPDEDAYYSATDGLHLGEISGTKEIVSSMQQREHELAKVLNGLVVKDGGGQATLEDVTEESIRNRYEIVQELIRSGKLKGLDIVADGAGGHGSGEFASSIATFMFMHVIASYASRVMRVEEYAMRHAIELAHNTILAYNEKYNKDAITTFVAQVTNAKGETFIASVGDARVYKQDLHGDVVRMTSDQSWVESFVETGVLNPSEVFTHKRKSDITNAVGSGVRLENIQVEQTTLQPGERLFLVCDGVWEGIDVHEPHTQTVFAQADRTYAADIASGMDATKARNKAFGYIFKEINLKDIADQSSSVLAEQLTSPKVGELSRDNTTAVVVQAK